MFLSACRTRSGVCRSDAPSARIARGTRRAMLLGLVFAAVSAPAAFAACAGSDLVPTGAVPPDYIVTTLCLINTERAEHGLGLVSHNGDPVDPSSRWSFRAAKWWPSPTSATSRPMEPT